MGGLAASEIEKKNAWSLVQLIFVPLVLVILLISVIPVISLKAAFWAVFSIWLLSGALVRTLEFGDHGSDLPFLLNFGSLY